MGKLSEPQMYADFWIAQMIRRKSPLRGMIRLLSNLQIVNSIPQQPNRKAVTLVVAVVGNAHAIVVEVKEPCG